MGLLLKMATAGLSLLALGFVGPSASQEALSSELAKRAVTWVLFVGNVNSTLPNPPASAAEIDQAALFLSAQIGPHSGESWLAFAAMNAASSDIFAASVRAAAAETSPAAYAAEIVAKPWIAAQLNGARQAAALASVALDASQFSAAVTRVKGYSYSLQTTPWAAAPITDNSAFLSILSQATALRATSQPQAVAYMDGMVDIGNIRFGLDSRQRPFFPGPFRTIIRDGIKEQILALAALRALGIDKTQPELVRQALTLERNRSCFAAAIRNMAQCTSANRRAYERIACMAQHQMEEPIACATKDVGTHSVREALAALSRPSHVQPPDGATRAVSVKRGPLSTTPEVGQIPLSGEAAIVDFIGNPAPQWFRVRGFVGADGAPSRVDGWVSAASVKGYRKPETPE